MSEPGNDNKEYTFPRDQLLEMTLAEGTCDGYIDGVLDQRLEGLGSHYNPVPSRISWRKTLIDTFIKYVTDHPEEEDFSASTVLHEAEKIMADAQKPR